jgi:hypothetical protein
MRFDDTLHVNPDEARCDGDGFVARLRQTKTTGPGKRVPLVTAYVGRDAFIAEPHWLTTGFAILQELGSGARDYLLPMPDASFEGFRRAPVEYADEMLMLRASLCELRCPRFDASLGWCRGDAFLVPPELAGFWTAHSHRAVLPSWGACLELDKRTIDAFGRWGASGADEYVRTLRAIVTRAQKVVGTSLRDSAAVAGGLGEDELFENMRAFLLEQQIEPPVVDGILSGFAFFGSARGQAPAPAQGVPASTDESDDDDEATPIANDDDEVSPGLDLPPPTVEAGTHDFIISITLRSKSRCLHVVNGCYRAKALEFACYELLPGPVLPAQYTAICRLCWKRSASSFAMAGPADDPEAEDSDSSVSSSSASSSH